MVKEFVKMVVFRWNIHQSIYSLLFEPPCRSYLIEKTSPNISYEILVFRNVPTELLKAQQWQTRRAHNEENVTAVDELVLS